MGRSGQLLGEPYPTLGLGGTGIAYESSPIPVAGLTNARQISVGSHACAALEDNTVACWGGNGHGELGDGTTNGSTAPVAVLGLTGVDEVAVAGSGFGGHSCALAGTSMKCWGANSYGELGNGSITDSPVPVAVTVDTRAVAGIAVGAGSVYLAEQGAFSCAVYTDGGRQCWGQTSTFAVTSALSYPPCQFEVDWSANAPDGIRPGCRPDHPERIARALPGLDSGRN